MLPSKGEGNTGAPGALHRHAQPSEMNFSQPLQHLDCPSEAPNVWTTISELCFSTSENTLYSRPHSIFSHSESRKGLASVFRLHRSGQSNEGSLFNVLQRLLDSVGDTECPTRTWGQGYLSTKKRRRNQLWRNTFVSWILSCVLIRLFI